MIASVKCPRCGKLNNPSAKFCICCGAKLHPARRQEQQGKDELLANQGYSPGYFRWLKDAFTRPLGRHEGRLCFGMITFAVLAVFRMVALFISVSNQWTSSFVSSLTPFLPIKASYEYGMYTKQPACIAALSILTVFIYYGVSYIAYGYTCSSHLGPLQYCNELAGTVAMNLAAYLALIVTIICGWFILMWLAVIFISMTDLLGIAYTVISTRKSRAAYSVAAAYLVFIVGSGLLTTVAGIVVQNI